VCLHRLGKLTSGPVIGVAGLGVHGAVGTVLCGRVSRPNKDPVCAAPRSWGGKPRPVFRRSCNARTLSLPAEPRALRLQVPFETWRDDEDLRLITERLVEIVGEAARAMTPETETLGHQSTGQD
jgi:hypothetical protein